MAGPCGSGALECAAMAVPRDWPPPGAAPHPPPAVARRRATGPGARKGVLRMAAGGPDASGLTRPTGLAEDAPKEYGTWWSNRDEVIDPDSGVPLTGAVDNPAGCLKHNDLLGDDAVSAGRRRLPRPLSVTSATGPTCRNATGRDLVVPYTVWRDEPGGPVAENGNHPWAS
ncbi:hypothetical protein ACFWBX_14310 [Streptomyces sp. NPDC059991]|uniref:hypothetical protein n=1 Tax=Streptomyces sp. NPDC059991 TaxID=3347028 RepID=UPI003675A4F5